MAAKAINRSVKNHGKKRSSAVSLNVSQRSASKSFFLYRKIDKKHLWEEAYENQYSDALLQAPSFNLSSCGKSMLSGANVFAYKNQKIDVSNIWKFYYVTEGSAALVTEGKTYPLKKGDIVLEPHLKEFSISLKKGEFLERLFFDFSGGIPESFLLTRELIGYTPCLLSLPDSAHLLKYFEELLALGKVNPSDASFTASKIIYSFILDLGRIKKHTRKDIRYKLYSILEPLTFKKYDLDALADSVGMSRRTLNRFFLKYLGKTPVEYIRIQKINFAAHALMTTDISVAELARICAYSSQSYFTRDFRLLMKVSPSEYRKAMEK